MIAFVHLTNKLTSTPMPYAEALRRLNANCPVSVSRTWEKEAAK